MSDADQLPNPYESPPTPTADRQEPETSVFTRQRVFWLGLAGIVCGLILVTGGQSLFVESRRADGAYDTLVVIIDCIAGLLFLGGIIALVVYHWFPDPNRKYSWRRKHTDQQGQRKL